MSTLTIKIFENFSWGAWKHSIRYCEFACEVLINIDTGTSIGNSVSDIYTRDRSRSVLCTFVHEKPNFSEYWNYTKLELEKSPHGEVL